MNKKQRNKNRKTAVKLMSSLHVCEECGEKGYHWVAWQGMSLATIRSGTDDQQGFWICDKFYDKNGRRI